ncbi:MAG TPA: site-specific integrase [Desulfomonilaceae bacterium]|nr:site-specific integrase [Desulfomonilaceae bacterium]
MSLQFRKETGKWRVRFKRTGPDGKREDIRVTLDNVTSERTARKIERALSAAIKYKDYRYLDDESRRVCIQLFKNRGWTLPPALITSVGHQGAAEELTLIKAIEYCMSDPEVLILSDPSRYEQSFAHILAYWGPDFPVNYIKVRQIKEYMLKRKKEKAANATINRERGVLSKMFKVLMQAELTDRNPVRETAPADEREGQRDVYLSFDDFSKIVAECPAWTRPIIRCLYFTGMRRKEVLDLTWEQVNLSKRLIVLGSSQTKERRSKRVPIHRLLIPTFNEAGKVRSLIYNKIFLNEDGKPPHEDSVTRAWRSAVESLKFKARPTPHDLRHCWKTNAMRSGVHPLIADAIVGHGDRKKTVESLYLSISDADLLSAIDRMTFDKGDTEIFVKMRGSCCDSSQPIHLHDKAD